MVVNSYFFNPKKGFCEKESAHDKSLIQKSLKYYFLHLKSAIVKPKKIELKSIQINCNLFFNNEFI